MFLSESYKKRIKELAGIVSEISSEDKNAAYNKSNQRIPFNLDLMKDAIVQGREVVINFQSNNEKYKMPIAKTRIIWPMALGKSVSGDMVLRVWHVTGQSEKVAIATGVRSAETDGEWRLLKISNLKTMWYSDRFFDQAPPGYTKNDSGMSSIIAAFDPGAAKQYQTQLANQMKGEKQGAEELEEKRKNIRRLFK